MNNLKVKSKKRKLSDLEESSGDDSQNKDEDIDTDSYGESSDNDEQKQEESNSDASDFSAESHSSSGSSVKISKKSKSFGGNFLSSDSSDSGDENSEKCAICLRSIKGQEVGNPEVCDHLFCAVCILEWSKNSNVCPLDRQHFSIILVRKNKDGETVKKVTIEEPQQDKEDTFNEFNDTVCEICGLGDREDIMLLCDICDRGFHTICLIPPLENVPDENRWFCPGCDISSPEAVHNREIDELSYSSSTYRSLRPRTRMVRTRLLERIRMTVTRIIQNLASQQADSITSDDESILSDYIESILTTDSEHMASEDQPSTSGLQTAKPKGKKSQTKTKKKTTRKRKRGTKSSSKGTGKRKTTTRKRKCTAGGKKKPTKKRKTRVRTTRTKKIKVENGDGTITEKIVKSRTYKRRRQKRRKKKVINVARRGLRVKSITTPKTVKGRLALTLGMVAPKKPGQLLPDVKIRSGNDQISAMDLNRARAGIPKLHIFEPRDELQYYSSDSDHDDFIGGSGGGVATLTQQRTNHTRTLDRKKAALVLQTAPRAPKPKPVIEPPSSENFDILGSIMDSQAIWHSKNTNVKINEDGSIEVIKDKNAERSPKPENEKKIDVREKNSEGLTTQAPMYPGGGSRPGGFRPHNRSNYGESRAGQENAFSPRIGQSSTGMNFNRFGGPPRNDREGYTNYLNSIPQGPTPFCRGGPPLRFRMPARQQLRRIPFPPRNRAVWQPDEDEEENENENNENKKDGEGNEQSQAKTQEEEDIDLYSDIETNTSKGDSGAEDGSSNYPALGPPPEPPAFLLGLDENGEFGVTENKDKSEVYDPAEPCDSDDEMVIDENKERSMTPERKESEPKKVEPVSEEPLPQKDVSTDETETKPVFQKESSEDDDEEDCPIFSIYSSATREFSQKEEEERQREIAEDRRKLEEMKLQDGQKSLNSSVELEKSAESELIKKDPGTENENLSKEKVEKENEKSNEKEETVNRSPKELERTSKQKELLQESSVCATSRGLRSLSPIKEVVDNIDIFGSEKKSSSPESEKETKSRSPTSVRSKSSSQERITEKYKRSKRKSRTYDSDSDEEAKKVHFTSDHDDDEDDDDKENEEVMSGSKKDEEDDEKLDKGDSEVEDEAVSQKVTTGLEGLDVEEVSSDNGDGAEFGDKRSLSSFSLSELSNASKRSRSPIPLKKKKKNKKKKGGKSKAGKSFEEGEIDDSEKDNKLEESFEASKNEKVEIVNENSPKSGEKRKRKSASVGSERQILGSKENKKVSKEKTKDKDLSWKKPSKKDKNYREGKKRSKDRGRSKSNDRRKSKSPSPKKSKKKDKDRKKKTDKKKDIERYDVRKIVKNKEVRKTDAFGRDIVSKSRSISRSRSRSPVRDRSRNMLRRDSRSFSRSRSRSFRRGRSPVRRRYIRSRTRSRSKSVRRSYSRSRSISRSRKSKKKVKSKDRSKIRSRSRARKSRSLSRNRRRSISRSRSRSPVSRVARTKKITRSKRSWSHHMSRSPSFSPRRSRSITRSPIRVRKSYSRSISTSWSRGRSPLPRTSSLEKLTVVLTTKDKKKWKKKKEGKKSRKEEKRRKKSGNSKEVFASGDNVLVSVNFRNNNNTSGPNSVNVVSNDNRNTRLNSLSPVLGTESSRKKKRGSDYESERVTKKSKKNNSVSKKTVDVALSNACSKRTKKLTRLSEKDAEVILNRKPVAVIDLDMSPYREQTPSPVNVVVVSDSGSGDEGKDHTPQRQIVRGTPASEVEKIQESVGVQSGDVSAPCSPVQNGYIQTSGPKTPPEPQIKFSISKPQQLRQIANPLGDDDDDDDEVEEDEGGQVVETLDRRIEKELNPRSEIPHKGPNTPPAPRGPSTPKTPPSPQTSPDVYDPFEPTKSRSPSPSQADKENRPSPKMDGNDEPSSGNVPGDNLGVIVSNSLTENSDKVNDVNLENLEDKIETMDKGEAVPAIDSSSNVVIPNQTTCAPLSDMTVNESPERKIAVVITASQTKTQAQNSQKPYTPVMKQLPIVSSVTTTPPTSVNLTVSSDVFSMPSPTKTSRSSATITTQTAPITGIQRLQHRLGSPVNRTPNSVKTTPEKRGIPRSESNEIFTSGKYMIRNVSKRNGEQQKQPRPLQDATNETIDITADMDDSPYSPASSEGDDLFDPPVETSKPSQSNSKGTPAYKIVPKGPSHKSPVKQLSKFDLLFGPSLSPLRSTNKKTNAKMSTKAATTTIPKVLPIKPQKKVSTKKGGMHKMDEDQLRILDELPSSAVELQVKDKFLKKLNRQERVVDEVKTVLKPHYARKHITKEEYKDILRRSVPKICHSKSGEINPSKIQSLIEAYVRKFRHAKKKGLNPASKPKAKKTMFS